MYSLHLNNNLVTLQITIMGACVLFGVPALVYDNKNLTI